MKPRMNLKPYTVTRTTAPAPVAGRRVAGVATSVPIIANCQPAMGRELAVLPQASHGEDVRVLYTATDLYVAGRNVAGTEYVGDSVSIGGEPFEVFKCEPWNTDHFRAYAARQVKP